MKMEPTYIELLVTLKVGMGEYFFKGQRFRKPFSAEISKELQLNPKAFKILDEAPPISHGRIISSPQYKNPIPPVTDPTEEDKEFFKRRGKLANEKAEEVREALKKMAGEEEETTKPKKPRRLPT